MEVGIGCKEGPKDEGCLVMGIQVATKVGAVTVEKAVPVSTVESIGGEHDGELA